MNKNNNLLVFLYDACIVLISFSSLPYFQGMIGEIATEGYFYPAIIGMTIYYLLFFYKKTECKMPKNVVVYLFLLWMFYILLSAMINIPSIYASHNKGKFGMERFIFQYLSMIFYAVFVVFIYNMMRKRNDYMYKFMDFLNVGFVVFSIYSAFEIAAFFGLDFGKIFLRIIGPYVHGSGYETISFVGRITGLSYEPSVLGGYLGFVFPWIVGWCYTKKKVFYGCIAFLYILLMVMLSASRTAYFIISIEIIMMCLLFFRKLFTRNNICILLILLAFILPGLYFFYGISSVGKSWISISDVFLSFSDNGVSDFNTSNVSRFSLQMSALNIFFDYPISGIGLGQFLFHFVDYIPDWGFQSSEMADWASSAVGSRLTGSFNLYLRSLAELGVIGFVLWINIWGILFVELFYCLKYLDKNERDLVKIIFVSLIGVLLSGLNFDTYRFPGYWFMISIGLVTVDKVKHGERIL